MKLFARYRARSAETFIGVRKFHITYSGHLRSPYYGHEPWSRRVEFTCRCRSTFKRHSLPRMSDASTCGIYSYKPDTWGSRQLLDGGKVSYGSDEAIAVVALYGAVILADDGYRSQYARIDAICFPRTPTRYVEKFKELSNYEGIIVVDKISELNQWLPGSTD